MNYVFNDKRNKYIQLSQIHCVFTVNILKHVSSIYHLHWRKEKYANQTINSRGTRSTDCIS